MAGAHFSDWIADGEKYAFAALSVKLDGVVPSETVTAELSVIGNSTFNIPKRWGEWLGTIRAREVEDCNLFLMSKKRSTTPDILDDENNRLMQMAGHFYAGLLLSSTFAPAHRPVLISGVRKGDEIDIRQQQGFEVPIPCIWRPYPPVLHEDIVGAARLAGNLGALGKAQIVGGHWRLFQTLHIYMEARTDHDILNRVHQYCRCIDGLILPEAGKTKQQFKGRTEMFIGPRHQDLMGEIYDVRSAVEHLHVNRYLEHFDRETRLDLLKKVTVVEHIARTSIAHVIRTSALWPYFANATALTSFWALPVDDRQRLWGPPIDPMDALTGFDPHYIHNGLLGGS